MLRCRFENPTTPTFTDQGLCDVEITDHSPRLAPSLYDIAKQFIKNIIMIKPRLSSLKVSPCLSNNVLRYLGTATAGIRHVSNFLFVKHPLMYQTEENIYSSQYGSTKSSTSISTTVHDCMNLCDQRNSQRSKLYHMHLRCSCEFPTSMTRVKKTSVTRSWIRVIQKLYSFFPSKRQGEQKLTTSEQCCMQPNAHNDAWFTSFA